MKMAKKLLALVLTGVMAMSVLTGCGSTASRQATGKLEGMLKEANPKATVEVGSETLANMAIDAATENGKLQTPASAKSSIRTALQNAKKDEYVWYTYFKAEGKNETDKAQAIANEILKTETNGSVTIGTNKAVNFLYVGIPGNYNIKAGDEFVLSMKEFTVKETSGGKATDVVYIMAVVTCKPVK